MRNDLLIERYPMFLGQYVHQIRLYLSRILRLGKTQSLRHAFYMRINDYARYPKNMPSHDVRRFSAYSRQLHKRVQIARHAPAVFIKQPSRAGYYVYGLSPIKSGRKYITLHFRQVGSRERVKR
jgi:hypothetical protein